MACRRQHRNRAHLPQDCQWGNIGRRAITPQTVNLVVKMRAKQAGLDPAMFSAHGLRSGYLTEAANRGTPRPEAMQQSLHKSITQAAGYYKPRRPATITTANARWDGRRG
jgi:integrase